ncbi:unnamed protein product [Durusdinium trenchii]|uniref:Uncharacterized protein n=2 Tax=Durusdinium trenchii TaxID=1381693 RepID=A0ABP0J6M2_9DINO
MRASIQCSEGRSGNSKLLDTEEVCHRRGKELAEARRAVAIFLENNRFDPSNTNSKRGWMVTYPLHEAVKQKNAYIVSKLLLFGADLKAKDIWGRTACDYAGAQQDIMRILQKHADYYRSPDVRPSGYKWQSCPPPRGFEEFFAKLEADPLVQVPSCEAEWLKIRGPKKLRVCDFGADC